MYTDHMRGVSFSDMPCSIARTLDLIGERWTLLILRDAFNGVRRFEDFREGLGIARNILADRLHSLVEYGLLEQRRYQERPDRYEYRLTNRARELFPVLIALAQWGDRYLTGDDGAPTLITHAACGQQVEAVVRCPSCDVQVAARDCRTHQGPGWRTPDEGDPFPVWARALSPTAR